MENDLRELRYWIDQMTGLIYTLSNCLRQLSLSALDLQSMAISKKTQIEQAIDNVDAVEEIIADLLEFLAKLIDCFLECFGPICCRCQIIPLAKQMAEVLSHVTPPCEDRPDPPLRKFPFAEQLAEALAHETPPSEDLPDDQEPIPEPE
jgi:hypothetical protein